MKRFWSKVDKTIGQGPKGYCWQWLPAPRTKNGYGGFDFEGKTISAHRFAYELQIGSIPDDMQVLHTCDNPKCVRGSHLFVGTPTLNMQDMTKKGRWKGGNKDSLRKIGPDGTAWCVDCQKFRSSEIFHKDKRHWNGFQKRCIKCAKDRRKGVTYAR